MTAQTVDTLFLVLTGILPVLLIIRWRFKGALLGAAAVWILGIVSGVMLSALDPKRDMAMLDSIWLLFGWIGGLLYCMPIWGILKMVRMGLGRMTSRSHQKQQTQ